MAGNTFGTIFKLTTFGESHGEAIGGIIEGCPAGLKIDIDFFVFFLSYNNFYGFKIFIRLLQ